VWIVFASLVVLLAGVGVYEAALPAALNGASIDPPKPMADFTLQSAKGPSG